MTTRLLDRLISYVFLGTVIVDGYVAGLQPVSASCTTPECAEVTGYATLAQLTTTPTVTNANFYSATYAVTVLSSNPLGGTPTDHNTVTTNTAKNCQPIMRDCANSTATGTYKVTFTPFAQTPSNCQAQPAVKRRFCANTSGSGVTNSWNAGKNADQ